MVAGYDSWIQSLCPSPTRYFQRLVVESGCRKAVDLGCGSNSLLAPLQRVGVHCTGVDASEAVLRECRQRDLFDEYACCDVLEWLRNEAQRGSQQLWNVVVASHLIEHLEREAGEELLRLVESLRPRLIYIGTPYGFVQPHHYQGDPLQAHRSGWFPWDFAARGYSVYGMGVRACAPGQTSSGLDGSS